MGLSEAGFGTFGERGREGECVCVCACAFAFAFACRCGFDEGAFSMLT